MGRKLLAAAAIMTFGLAACSFAPTYQVPATPVPAAYKEAGNWVQAQATDQIPEDGWWRVYRDAELNKLETGLAASNPNLEAALARHDQAVALLQQARSGLFPTIGAEADLSRQRQSDNRPLRGAGQPADYNSATVDVGLNYDLDLWGAIRNQVKAGKYAEEASAADVEAVRLGLEANLASAWFNLVGLDLQSRILADTITTYQRALALTVSRHSGGIASDLDVSRAKTQLDLARAQASDTTASRALVEHAIATLIGVPASSFSLPPNVAARYLPTIPTGVPSTLLQRRPDIVAAERRVAQANAEIGVAKAAYFPDVSLGLDGGYQSDTLSPWIAAPNEIWSIGPSLVMTLFDGGLRAAKVRGAQAKLAENGAKYKATVLTAFQQVEDNLALLHYLGTEATQEDDALAAAKQTLNLSMSQYRDGVVSYLDVVTAQTTELTTELADTTLQTRQLDASVGLIEALGGGWAATPPVAQHENEKATDTVKPASGVPRFS